MSRGSASSARSSTRSSPGRFRSRSTVPQQHTPQIVIKVAADRREGIDVTEINVGGDSVLVGERVGGPPVVKFISKVNPARGGFTEFEVALMPEKLNPIRRQR